MQISKTEMVAGREDVIHRLPIGPFDKGLQKDFKIILVDLNDTGVE